MPDTVLHGSAGGVTVASVDALEGVAHGARLAIVVPATCWLTVEESVERELWRTVGAGLGGRAVAALRERGGQAQLGEVVAVVSDEAAAATTVLFAVVAAPDEARVLPPRALRRVLLRALDHAAGAGLRGVSVLLDGSAAVGAEGVAAAMLRALRTHVTSPTDLQALTLVSGAASSDALGRLSELRRVLGVKAAPALASGREGAPLAARVARTGELLMTLSELLPSESELLQQAFDLGAKLKHAPTTARGPAELQALWREAYVAVRALERRRETRSREGLARAEVARLTAAVDGWLSRVAMVPVAAFGWLTARQRSPRGDGASAPPSESPTAEVTADELGSSTADGLGSEAGHPDPIGAHFARLAAVIAPEPTTAVGRLAELLIGELGPARSAELAAELQRRWPDGAGALRERLSEHLLTVDLPEFLMQHLSGRQLGELLERRFGCELRAEPSESRARACRVLEECGFCVPRRPEGLGTFRRELLALRSRADAARPAEAPAIVVEAGRLAERLLKRLIEFHCLAYGGGRPDDVLRVEPNPILPPARPFGASSLGTLLGVLAGVETATPPAWRSELRRAVHGQASFRPILSASRLVELRNRAAHDRGPSDGAGGISLADAREVVDTLVGWVAHLSAEPGRLFPTTVCVRGVRSDEWGRTVADCETDEGRPESISTEERIAPGEHYYMCPISNPVRVGPLLVSYGPVGRAARARAPLR